MNLYPCPFCGHTALQGDVYAEWLDDTKAAVFCRHCKAEGPEADTPEQAANKWNLWWGTDWE